MLLKKTFFNNSKKNTLQVIKKDYDNLLKLYQSYLAHQEMVIKAEGGLEKMFNKIDNQKEYIELMKQKILSLMRENILMEKQLVNLTTTYKFKFSGIYIEINKERIKDTIKNKFLYKNFITCKKFIVKIPIHIFCIIFKSYKKILYNFRYIIYLLNLIFLLNNIRQ